MCLLALCDDSNLIVPFLNPQSSTMMHENLFLLRLAVFGTHAVNHPLNKLVRENIG